MDAVQTGAGVVRLGGSLCSGAGDGPSLRKGGESEGRLRSGDFRVPGTGDRRDWTETKSKQIGTGRVREKQTPAWNWPSERPRGGPKTELQSQSQLTDMGREWGRPGVS